MNPKNREPFRIGLCLAGAVSAGAYTAGVMDYLLEALDEWERRKREDKEHTPNHQVEIPVIGGASAGAMTAIITAAALHGELPPVKWVPSENANALAEHPENKLYHSWVDLTSSDMFPVLLDTSDLKHPALSLLNADFISKLADQALAVSAPWLPRAYINDRLKVFATLTNLEGLHFDIALNATSSSLGSYYIGVHQDYACFELNITESQYGNHGWIPLNFSTGLNSSLARDAAMATGAFPVGLPARKLERSAHYVNEMEWLRSITAVNPLKLGTYSTTNVDGGLINNEPFERVRDVLNAITGQGKRLEGTNLHDYNSYSLTKGAVLMVDPFPSSLESFDPGTDLITTVQNTMGAMIGQLRTKAADLADAFNSDKAGQFVIAPSRKLPTSIMNGKDVLGAKAIACGTFGGFGGFLHKEFRVHDFFLGRANCEKFLRDQFTMREAANNPIIEAGYSHITDRQHFRSQTDKEPGLQIIPIFSDRTEHIQMPKFSCGLNWPVRKEADIDRFRQGLKQRADALIRNMVHPGLRESVLLWIGRKIILNGKAADSILNKIKTSLLDSKLLN